MRHASHPPIARGSIAAVLPALLAATGCSTSDADDPDRVEESGAPLAEGGPIERTPFALTTTGGLSADTKVRSGSYAGNNYGSSSTLQSDGDDGGTQYHTYVKFAIGNVGTINSCKLRFYVQDPSNGPHSVRAVANTSWSESGMTWNNKPATGATIATIGSTTKDTWVEVDVTTACAPNTTVSLAIVPGTTNGMDLRSRNHGTTSTRPQVVIVHGESGGTGGTGGSASGGTGGSASGGTGGTAPQAATRIAFVGDTGSGTAWGNVLNLALAEGAHAVVVAGDMTYNANPSEWWNRTESVVGTSYPVFLARGNHDDSSWSGFLTKAASHLGGATRVNGAHDANYLTVFRGVALAAIRKGDGASHIDNLFHGRGEFAKVCYWHQNQNKLQVGGKSDEMGYTVFETCRNQGAVIINGHEHTYHRTKTLSSFTNQTIASNCTSSTSLCVGPTRSWLAVVGTGGIGLRDQVRCAPTASTPPYPSLNTSDASCPIWASIYTNNQGAQYGALFVTFNVDGNPRKGNVYFKNVSGQVIDSFSFIYD